MLSVANDGDEGVLIDALFFPKLFLRVANHNAEANAEANALSERHFLHTPYTPHLR
jgi:hypothetical protein